ncbi:hypothetical protein [Rathayibacter sp. VKM Ac-2630]|uniref:hypothetical protein n=1 Tax=Rathayibacter sp. VKM Ac-2630 TaxID=1938617 RepID=UPI0009821842|nr:hypothetical protein [Rathayibacter sp. VKM Ac-2630]OOB90755.1 hypothetical protein B0T42_10130 [Rathayibacter sp. VKM Ac-2630]
MVATDPSTNDRRLRWERTIWIIDQASYALMAVSGFVALFATSTFVLREVTWPEAIIVWGLLLLGGGAAGFVGRLVKVWAIEILGNVAAMSGGVIYVAIVLSAVTGGSSLVLLAFVTAATVAILRRYAELQIFTSEPGLDTFSKKVRSLLRRRTSYTVRREHY